MHEIGILGFGKVGENFYHLLQDLSLPTPFVCDTSPSKAFITTDLSTLKACALIVVCTAKASLQAHLCHELKTLCVNEEKIRLYTDCFYARYWLQDSIKYGFDSIDMPCFISMLLEDSPNLQALQKKLRTLLEHTPKSDKNQQFYDDVYRTSPAYSEPYDKSVYYRGWEYAYEILENYRQDNQEVCVLDVGCGAGDFARMLYERNILEYTGIDFSPQAIKIARAKTPHWSKRLIQENILTTHRISQPYTHICLFEVLEHISADLELLSKIPPRTHILASVPNFYSQGHIRIFQDTQAIIKRYGFLLDFEDFFELVLPKDGAKIFYFHARKKQA
ncbi:hypothetical protein BKH46_02700 [Helicobacter sp. 12S02634-8]|uniref:class I SAM-dependent methyltransferase n=1 Tax=Helicobacter sp. 12S02634-8 TaxID=1476199 RepID=UPI000BA5A8A0|nr:class I SAM-dependent methyltransferase [Helicobacter sp. 12S02634-8]PAF47765.1 hypothetical protein BKH46_02700 [Helicobacter sp. 12S02634-8]